MTVNGWLSETPRGLTANRYEARSSSSLFSLAQIVFNLEGGSVLTAGQCKATTTRIWQTDFEYSFHTLRDWETNLSLDKLSGCVPG